MLRVASATLKRLLRDKKLIIGIFVAPVIIIMLFSLMSNDNSLMYQTKIGVYIDVKDDNKDKLINKISTRYQIIYADNQDAVAEGVRLSKYAYGLIIEDSELDIVATTNDQANALKWEINNYINSIRQDKEVEVFIDDKYEYKGAGMMTNFMVNFCMFSLIYIAVELIDLKNNNLIKRIYSMPNEANEIISGHVVAFLIILCIQMLLVNITISFLFDVTTVSNLLWGVLINIAFILVTLSLGILVSQICNNSGLVPLYANLILMPCMMLSGTFLQIDSLGIFAKLKYLTPQYWVVSGYNEVNAGSSAWGSVIVMLLMVICILSAGTLKFNRFVQD